MKRTSIYLETFGFYYNSKKYKMTITPIESKRSDVAVPQGIFLAKKVSETEYYYVQVVEGIIYVLDVRKISFEFNVPLILKISSQADLNENFQFSQLSFFGLQIKCIDESDINDIRCLVMDKNSSLAHRKYDGTNKRAFLFFFLYFQEQIKLDRVTKVLATSVFNELPTKLTETEDQKLAYKIALMICYGLHKEATF